MSKSKKNALLRDKKVGKSTARKQHAGTSLLPDEELPTHGISQSPIDELREMPTAFSDLGGNYRAELNLKLARVYAIALTLRDDRDLWQNFCRLPEWEGFKGKKPQIDDISDVLQPCIRLAVGFHDANASKTASKYFNALSVPFKEQIPAAEVPAYIERNGGIEELAKRAAKSRREGNAETDDEALFRLVDLSSELADKLMSMAAEKPIKGTFKFGSPDARGVRQIEIIHIKTKTKQPKTLPKPL